MIATAPALPRLIVLTMRAERQIRRWISDRGGGGGITAASAGVLFFLAANPNSTLGDITSALGASPAGASELVGRLARAGLVVREVDSSDRRTLRVNISSQGIEAKSRAATGLIELNSTIRSGFTASELDIVARWLAHVAKSLC